MTSRLLILLTLTSCVADLVVFNRPKNVDFQKCHSAKVNNWKIVDRPDPNIKKGRLRYYIRETPMAKSYLINWHGKGESACSSMRLTKQLEKEPVNIVYVEYPGFAQVKKSPLPSQKRILQNSISVFKDLQKKNIFNLPMYIYGVSLGTGPATYLATQVDADGLILHAPYTSIYEAAKNMFKIVPYGLIRSTFKSYQWAPKVSEPVLILHGTNDKQIPISMGRKLADKFTNTDVDFVELPGGHNSIISSQKYWEKMREFIGL